MLLKKALSVTRSLTSTSAGAAVIASVRFALSARPYVTKYMSVGVPGSTHPAPAFTIAFPPRRIFPPL